MKNAANAELDDKISLLYQIGNSINQVARRLKTTPGIIRSSLKRTNTERRTISEAGRLKSKWY